jgi:translocation and assembly module TamB
MSKAGKLLRAMGLSLLGLIAAIGVFVAASGWVATTGPGSRLVAGWLTGALDGVVAGRLTVGSLTIRPGGDVDMSDLLVVDPAGHPVIRVARARAHIELGGWAVKSIRAELELDRPEVWLEPDEKDGLTIAAAFTPIGPVDAAGRPIGDPWDGWTIHVVRLGLHDASVIWRGEQERTWLKASGIELDGAGTVGTAGIAAGLTLAGKVEVPLEGPLDLKLAARIDGTRLRVPLLSLGAASSRLEAFGEWDWDRETFRAAASRLALAEKDLAVLAGQPITGVDLQGRLYAESDGKKLTAAADLTAPGSAHGGGSVALAFWFGRGSPRSVGFDAALDQLDPARVLSRAPRGRVSVTGRGALTWPVPAPGQVSRGHVTVDRLDVALPGLSLQGEGRWRDAGARSGAFQLMASDLSAAGPAVEALLGITLPALAGQGEANLTLAGTAAVPEATLSLLAPRCEVAGTLLTGARAELKLSGAAVELEASAKLGLVDGANVTARSAATLTPGWKGAAVTRLELGLAGRAWTLVAPANVTFDGPRVDRAELRSGVQRLALSGGIQADGTADTVLEVSELDLAQLPPGLLPASLGLSGRANGSLRLAGTVARRTLDAKADVSDGALAPFAGLALKAELAWRRQTGRLGLDAALRRADGGTVDLSADLPWPLDGARPGLGATGRVAVGGWPLQELLQALQVDLAVEGRFAGELTLAGTAGAPRLAARAVVTEGRWTDVAPLTLTVTLEGTGPTLGATAELLLADAALARASAELPFDRGALLAHPGRTLARMGAAAWSAQLELPGTELASLAGKAGLPHGITGRLGGEATLRGTPAAPRGTGSVTLANVVLSGYPAVSGRAAFALEPARTTVTAELESGGAPALRLVATLAAPVEALGRAEVQRRAPLQLSAVIPKLTLPGSPGIKESLAGQVALKLELAGTLAVPQGTLALDATGLTRGGLPLGDLKGTARTADGATRFDFTLVPSGGGTLRLDGTLGAVPGIWTAAADLAVAPLQMAVTGHDLSVAFLPALLPGKLRAASGKVETELAVTGSAREPRVVGTLTMADGMVTLASLGSFTGVAFEASFAREAIRVKGLSVRRGPGRLEGNLALEGLDEAEPRLDGAFTATNFTLSRAGMDVVTIDARAGLGGRYRERRLEAVVTLERGATIRLPRKAPRDLQPLEDRADIVIGGPDRGTKPVGSSKAEPGAPAADEPLLTVTIRVRSEELLVKSDKPRVHLELRTDSNWDVTASPLKVAGTLDAVQGTFEPIGGRLFTVVRGHVGFTGGPLGEAQLDLAADHETPNAKIHATVGGTIEAPNLRLTSEPPLDEATLAMLIVTGRAEMNVGGTQGPAFKAQDAGMAAAMVVANRAFEEKLGEKMPLDSLTIDSSAVTAGKQLTDRIRVNYVRRFDARPEKGENVDEVRVQYHLSPRWTLESRYGGAGAGGASLIWQKDY